MRSLPPLTASRELESFLREVSVRAFRIARFSLRNDADASDAVQEAMVRMVRFYGDRDAQEWTALFYAILRNCVHDEQRRRRSRGSLLSWVGRLAGRSTADAPAAAEDPGHGPAEQAESDERLVRLEQAIAGLPDRQREVFLLRNIEELDVAQTARAMGCSEGSVKTHYSRAVHALREKMRDP